MDKRFVLPGFFAIRGDRSPFPWRTMQPRRPVHCFNESTTTGCPQQAPPGSCRVWDIRTQQEFNHPFSKREEHDWNHHQGFHFESRRFHWNRGRDMDCDSSRLLFQAGMARGDTCIDLIMGFFGSESLCIGLVLRCHQCSRQREWQQP